LVAATVAPPAGAADLEEPAGASYGSTTVLSLEVGDLLDLRLLGEDGSAAFDGAKATGEALTRLVPIQTSLVDLGALVIEERSTAGERSRSTDAVNLTGALPAGLPAGLLGGSVGPARLLAAVTGDGAHSSITAVLDQVGVLDGLLAVESADVLLGNVVEPLSSSTARGLRIDRVTVLDLSGLLALVGLELGDLSPEQLLGLVERLGLAAPLADALGITVPEVGDLDGLVGSTADLLRTPGALADQLCAGVSGQASAALLGGGLPGGLGDLVDGVVDEVVGLLPEGQSLAEVCALGGAALNTLVEGVVLGLLELLTDVLDGVTGVLAGAPLLSVSDIDAGVRTAAARTVEASSASAPGDVGTITVGNLSLGALPAGADLAQVNGLVDQVQGTLDGVLAPIGLGGLVDIGLLERTTDVTETDGVVFAVAALTALRATVTPPDICALLTSGLFAAPGSVGALVDELGLGLDLGLLTSPVSGLLDQLGSVIGCATAAGGGQASAALLDLSAVTALNQPLTLRVAEVSGTSVYGVTRVELPAAPARPDAPAAPVLPRTGSSAAVLLLGAAALGALALGGRRLLQGR
jgi:hypothetical protein